MIFDREKIVQVQDVQNTNEVVPSEKVNSSNGFALFLRIFGVVLIGIAFIIGIVLSNDRSSDYSFFIALPYWISGSIVGLFFVGFGYLLQYLYEINERLKKMSN